MSNTYIEIYEDHKSYEQKDTIDALMDTLKRINQDEMQQQEGWLKPIWQGSKDKVLGFFQGFKAKPPYAKSEVVINKVIDDLRALKTSEEYQAQGETANTHLELLGILGGHFKEIDPKSKLHELFNYVMFHEGSIDFSLRESSIIEPSPLEMLTGAEEPYEEEEQWELPDIQELLKTKNLPLDIFSVSEQNTLSLDSDINDHARWAFQNIYCFSYPQSYPEEGEIARVHHGIEHVSRAAMYAIVFANLYRKHGNQEAEKLSAKDIKLIQIALLFHDAAREDENEDHWDHESAVFLYYYLTAVLGVDATKAKLIAEATANKDPSPEKGYFELFEEEDGSVSWQFSQSEDGQIPPKNIFQKIIHDCDCLDIIRARNQYNATYLDFYKEIASKEGNEVALEEMAELVMEARSLIYTQGDARIKINLELKKHYEHEDAYARIKADVNPENYPLIFALYERLLDVNDLKDMQLIDLRPFDEQLGMTGDNLNAALREGRILARGIGIPSAKPKIRPGKPVSSDATLAEKEIRKTMRAELMNVKSRKAEPHPKHHNPMRSTSILGHGSGVYPSAGMLIFNPDIANISRISSEDFNSGRGSKTHLAHLQEKSYRKSSSLLEHEYQGLLKKMKLGLFGKPNEIGSNYVELLYDINRYDAIFYTPDPTIANKICHHDYDPVHPFSPLLQAIYIQKQYERQYEYTKEAFVHTYGEEEGKALFIQRFGLNKSLPIYEYSGQHNTLKRVDPTELTEERIIEMWISMCSDFMAKRLKDVDQETLYTMSVDDIKVLSMYGYKKTNLAGLNQSADLNYPEELRELISQAIERERAKLINAHEDQLLENLNNNEQGVFSKEFFINLQYSARLQDLSKKHVKNTITHFIQSMPELSFKDDLVFRQEYKFLAVESLEKLRPARIANNQLLQAYFLCRKYDLDDEAEHIRNKAMELANQLILDWQESDHLSLQDASNLKKFMTIIKADEKILERADAYLLKIIENKTNNVIHKRNNLFEFTQSIFNLSRAELTHPECLKLIETAYNHVGEKVTELDTYNLCAFLNIASLLGKNPQQEFYDWLSEQTLIDTDNYKIIEALKKVIVFDDNNLHLFKALLEKIHTNDSRSNYVNLDYWIGCMQNLKSIVLNREFSEKQLEILNEKYHKVIVKLIEDNINSEHSVFRRALSENRNKWITLMSVAGDLSSILKTNFFPVPECLLEYFNSSLVDLTHLNFDDTQLDLKNLDVLKKLHRQLPQQEKRQEAMSKLDECFIAWIKAEELKETASPQQVRLV
ncbi:SidE phosphodiesterase domain-containing protein [Legionella sp. PATHC035]|uniref:SidE phosphodiesterase domain-containing protein n=1 Tax=Legionella sp. PATHC035 TaxID=2992040 RepID=UPI00224353D4|nr:SidE phosphodiesterase domain-containing protein [Legionella sp. PATHC035]MCW8410267.1 SidE phosphodiesterase domain-containing protein [Legionella sp. PATHC035]